MRLVEEAYTFRETKGTNDGYYEDMESKNEKSLRR